MREKKAIDTGQELILVSIKVEQSDDFTFSISTIFQVYHFLEEPGRKNS